MKSRNGWIARAAIAGAIVLAIATGLSKQARTAEECGYAGDVAAGEQVYNSTCIACHGADGTGEVPGVPDFTKKGGALSKPHSALAEHIDKGFDSGRGLAMPPRGGNPGLTDEDLANVHAYLHATFGCG